MASPIKRKAVSSIDSSPSTVTSPISTQRKPFEPTEYAYGLPEEVYVTEKIAKPGGGLTHQEALHLYSLSAAELEKIGPTELRNKSWHQITVNDVKETKDKIIHFWNLHGGVSTAAIYYKHLTSQFNGGTGHKWPYKYTNPTRTLDQEDVATYAGDLGDHGKNGKRPFLTRFGEVIWKYEDVDTYLSPSKSIPRRVIVQATVAARKDQSPVSWRRTEIKGTIPLALRIAEWSLSPTLSRTKSFFRQALVALPLQALLALPGANAPWEMTDVEESYLDYPGYHWKWPKHAINPLDTREGDRKRYEKPEKLSSKQRLYRPRQLVVLQDEEWQVVENPPKDLQYIFISYHWDSFAGLADRVDIMAQYMCQKAGLKAYFQDWKCNAPKEQKDLLTADVNRMCDAIRGSQFVALLLPDGKLQRKRDWGRRMWTLPEGLLAPSKLQVCTWLRPDEYSVQFMGKVELTSQFWDEADKGSEEVPGRILAEHYEGLITLSRLELFSTAILALKARVTTNDFTGADLAYALMGLLHYRIDPDPTDDLFQVIARLSLANDNDRLIERLTSMFPKAIDDKEDFIKSIAEKDQYETHAWDIEPRCQVVGVGDEPSTVILSECRAVPIRWKRFPRMMYKRHQGQKKRIAELVIRSGAWWIVTGYGLAFTYAPIFLGWAELSDTIGRFLPGPTPHYERWLWAAILLFICTGLVLSIFAPKSVRRLFGGAVLQAAPHLVAFEGTLPRADLERIVFGGDAKRLRYEPSSTPFSRDFRHPYIRRGIEPDWITQSQPELPIPGHHWFTLVDTGNLCITVFQAKRPPTVAFITGAEGGMLRAVLCSWRFANDCHYRETVIRVPSNTWALCRPSAWVKVSLQSQDDLFAVSNRPRTWTANAAPPQPPAAAFVSPLPPPSSPSGAVHSMIGKAHAATTSVQSLNSAERLREIGSGVKNKVQQTKQRTTSSSAKPLPQQPDFNRQMNMSSVTTNISSQGQSPLYGQQQRITSATPSIGTPQPSPYLTRPQIDPSYAQQSHIQSSYTSSPQQIQSPKPSHPAPLQTSEPTHRSPVPVQAHTINNRPSLVSCHASEASHTVPNGPHLMEDGDYGFITQPLLRAQLRSSSSNASASSHLPASYIAPTPPKLVLQEHEGMFGGKWYEEEEEEEEKLPMYA
ncbi:hypothetical protein MMC17_004071 [Xylographa soralifera]|nr:hypothetical protein [Xylographa soralifera]